MVGHPSALRLILVDPCAVHRSHATLSLTSAEPNLLRPEPVTRAQASPLGSEGLTRAQTDLACADRGTGAEGDPAVGR